MSTLEPRSRLTLALVTMSAVAVLFRCWTSLCFFPLPEWNNVRLAPTFMLFHGSTPYPASDGSPLTTWIYGPVTLLVNGPAALGGSPASALMIAAVITLLAAVLPAIFAVTSTAGRFSGSNTLDSLWAVLLCLALWPNPSLHYIQADNIAVAFGLLSNCLLMRNPGTSKQPGILLAALCVSLSGWSKQPSFGLIPAQLLWIGITAGFSASALYGAACFTICLLLGGIFAGWFGLGDLWLNLVQIPSHLPFYADPIQRTRDFWMHLCGYILLPGIGIVVMHRAIRKKDSPWLLPAITWIFLLPLSLASTYKIGGATNSLNSFLYLLPVGVFSFVHFATRHIPRFASIGLTSIIFAVLIQQLKFAPLIPLRPKTESLAEADELARKLPHQIYFPWHPLVTFFSDNEFYDVEDGFSTRQAAQIPLNPAPEKHRLPAHWSMTAVPGWRSDGLYRQLQPGDARVGVVGRWTVYYWSPPSISAPSH